MGRDISGSHAGKVGVMQASVGWRAVGGEPVLSAVNCVVADEQAIEAFNIFLKNSMELES